MFTRMVMEEAGGEGKVITHRALYKVTADWEEEPLVTRYLERVSTEFVLEEEEGELTTMSTLLEREEVGEGEDPVVGALELCLTMLMANRQREERMEEKEMEDSEMD